MQLKAIMDSQAPTFKKGIQQLTGWMAALGRFIFCFTYRLKPFFITLKRSIRVDWNEECDQAFMAIKQYLTKPPILASLGASDTLYLYLVVSEVSVSVALFTEDKNRKQRQIFFIRKSLA